MIVFNHVALLVSSVERAAGVLADYGLPVGPAQLWAGEGTKEIYVGDLKNERGLLLLMEPVSEGTYARALAKRGPGLHHLAFDAADVRAEFLRAQSAGWIVVSDHLSAHKTVWLRKSGFAGLIELSERTDLHDRPPFVTGVAIPSPPSLMATLAVPELAESAVPVLTFRGRLGLSLNEILTA